MRGGVTLQEQDFIRGLLEELTSYFRPFPPVACSTAAPRAPLHPPFAAFFSILV